MQLFSGLEYLKIDIASSFGLDKLNWDQRIAWTDANIDHLESLLTEADTPALYFAGVQALRKTQRGEPSGYPINLDATSSGLQLLAAMTGCRASALLCNLVSTGNREDAYTVIYKAMGATMDEIADGVLKEMSKINPAAATISREDCKQAINQ